MDKSHRSHHRREDLSEKGDLFLLEVGELVLLTFLLDHRGRLRRPVRLLEVVRKSAEAQSVAVLAVVVVEEEGSSVVRLWEVVQSAAVLICY